MLLKKQDFKLLKEAGVDRYLLRFETSDPKLYSLLKPGHTLTSRITALHHLKDLGYEVGSGYMTGLPGETETTRINNALLAQQLKLNMVGVGPFIPNPFTPLSAHPQESLEQAIRAVAYLRLLLPKANIPATTAAGSLEPDGRELMLKAGANVLMPNLTPTHSKKHYQLYPNKICLDEEITKCLGCLARRIKSVGKQICWDRGDARQ